MKTVFKVGMEVWDKTISPNKGRVIEAFTDTKFDFPIKVKFDDDLKIDYTGDGCFVKSEGAIPTLSTSDYSIDIIGFEQKAPAITFEEAWEESERVYEPKSEYDKEEFGGYPSQDLANAAEALRRLLFLRDYYNKGWQADWKDDTWKYVILTKVGIYWEFIVDRKASSARVLHFKSQKIAEKFLEEQKELLEIARPLL